MVKELDLCELVIGGFVIGVFSCTKKAQQHADKNYPDESYSIFPLGTLLKTDIKCR